MNGTKQENNTNIKTLLKLFGAKKTTICDFSSYESPDVTFDLNYKVKNNHINKYDLILDLNTRAHIRCATSFRKLCQNDQKNGHIIICAFVQI